MPYPIPQTPQEIAALCKHPIDADVVAAAIAGVIFDARSQGKSLEDLIAEVLEEDHLLDTDLRQQLSDIVSQAWKTLA